MKGQLEGLKVGVDIAKSMAAGEQQTPQQPTKGE
jgi:hypothetical protein